MTVQRIGSGSLILVSSPGGALVAFGTFSRPPCGGSLGGPICSCRVVVCGGDTDCVLAVCLCDLLPTPHLPGHLSCPDTSPARIPLPAGHLSPPDTSPARTLLPPEHLSRQDTSPRRTPLPAGHVSRPDTSPRRTRLPPGHLSPPDTSPARTPLPPGHLSPPDTSPARTPLPAGHLSCPDTSPRRAPLPAGHLSPPDTSPARTRLLPGHLSRPDTSPALLHRVICPHLGTSSVASSDPPAGMRLRGSGKGGDLPKVHSWGTAEMGHKAGSLLLTLGNGHQETASVRPPGGSLGGAVEFLGDC
ncbi:uncharacterized protein LOC114673978 [Macaca mulatta]